MVLYEISKFYMPYSKHEDVFTSWNTNVFALRSEKGIQLYELTCNLQCMDKNIDNFSRIIPTPKSSPLTSFIPYELIKSGVSNIELTQMMIDPAFWSYNPELVEEMANVVGFKFSPRSMSYNNIPTLAVLNNIGGVEFFAPGKHGWTRVLNLSDLMKTCLTELKQPTNIEELKQVARRLTSTAICWGPLNKRTCAFVTAQKNGSVLFWLVENHELNLNAKFLGEVQTDAGEIVETHWIQKSESDFILICTNTSGQIYALDCYFDAHDGCICKLRKMTYLWPNKDKMIAKYIQYSVVKHYIALVFNKHRHLLAIMIDLDCKVLAEVLKNVNDHKITNITSVRNNIYLTTINCKVYQVMLSGDPDGFDVHPEPMVVKESYTNHDLHGISVSNNGVLMAAALINRDIKYRKEPLQITVVLLTDYKICETKILLENPTRKLTDYWDCIEVLRHKTLRMKRLPNLDFSKLYEDAEINLYILKVYYVFASFYNVLEKLTKNGSRGAMPETSLEVLRDKLFFYQAIHTINLLYADFKETGKTPQDFKLESYMGVKRYINYYCKKYDKDIDKVVSPRMMCLAIKNEEITCQCCDETLIGFTCSQGHVNMFCTLTFTLIDSFDYLICKCGCTARIELYHSKPQCLFCDLYLSRFSQYSAIHTDQNRS